MQEFKSAFYSKYVSTHIADRKGLATLDEFRIRAKIYQAHFGAFLPADKTARILDIGCGNGSIVWWLQQNGYKNACGIDISAEQIDVGLHLGVQNIEEADLKGFLLKNSRLFDVIIARDVIEHFEKEAVIEVLNHCFNSLKQEGQLILQVPNAESPFFGRIRYGDFTHELAFSASSLHQVMKMVGFKTVRCFSSGPTVTGVRSWLRSAAWKLFEKLYKFVLYLEVGKSPMERVVTQNVIAVAMK